MSMEGEENPMVTADAGAILLTDEELGVRFAAGDRTAVDDLYIRWAARILDFVSGIVRDRAVAEDITQATFVRAIEARTTLRDPTKVRAWLYTIARNLALKQLKGRRRDSGGDIELLGVAAHDAPEDEVIGRATADLVWKAATSLSASTPFSPSCSATDAMRARSPMSSAYAEHRIMPRCHPKPLLCIEELVTDAA